MIRKSYFKFAALLSMCITAACSDDDPGGGKSEVKVPENAVDLSAAGTANCYIVKPGGTVVFDAQYKGNSTTESIGNPVTAELVWQDAKNLIQDIYYVSKEKKIVAVTAPGTSGNAVAACGADGEILWSWHLWIADYDPAASLYTTPANASGTTWTFMDRNVGATTNAPDSFDCHGMIYQWGRKDPFTSAGTFTIINEDYSYQVDGERPIYNILNEELPKMRTRAEYHGTIAKSLRNPAVFYAMTYNFTGETDEYGQEIVLNDYRTKDWTDVSNDDYWGGVSGKKTIYDPCPVGYKVPTCDKDGNTPYAWLVYADMTWDDTNHGATQNRRRHARLRIGRTRPSGAEPLRRHVDRHRGKSQRQHRGIPRTLRPVHVHRQRQTDL